MDRQNTLVLRSVGAVDIAACCVFNAGDIMVGLEPVDSRWWQATLNGVTGIIPLTHVVELHPSDGGHTCNLWSSAALPLDDSKSSVNSELVGTTVVADSDLTAQLDYDLTFCRGDVICVLEDLGDGFAIGQCNGAVGQFPLCFCTPTDPETAGVLPSPEKPPSINATSHANSPSWKRSGVRTSSYTLANTRSQDCSVIPYCSTLYEFRGRSSASELSFGIGEIVHLISHLDDDWCFGELDGKYGAFPTTYVDIIVDCDTLVDEPMDAEAEPIQSKSEMEATAAVTVVQQTSSSRPVNHGSNAAETYGRLICDFVALNVNEVDASEGETVTVLERINEEWLEVRHDNGRVGLCPASYVELFGAEPKPEPATKPDIRTPPVVKPKLPVKPKLLTTTKSPSTSSSNVDRNRKSPVLANPPEANVQPAGTQPHNGTFNISTDDSLSSPKTETVKWSPSATPTDLFVMSRQPASRGLSLDELVQAELSSAKSASSTPATSLGDTKPSSQITSAGGWSDAMLNGVADVAGQSGWHTFSDVQQVSPPTVTRKPPPPPRPAPSRPPMTSVVPSVPNYGDKSGVDVFGGLTTQRKPLSNLIDFSPDHNTGK